FPYTTLFRSVQNSDGSFSVTGEHDYGGAGEYYVSVEVDASDGSMDWGGETIVAHADPMVVTQTIDSYPAKSDDTSNYLGSFFDIQPGQESDYTVTIHWGDGSPTSTGSVQKNSDGGFDIYGGHAYDSTGDFNVSVTITKSDGA